VVLAYLYGSQATGKAGPLSDVDVAVLFADHVPEDQRFSHVLDLIGELMGVFRRNDVYVVDLGKAPPLLRNEIRLQGYILYCMDDKVRVRFQTETLRDYLDTRPIRELRYYYLHKRIRAGLFAEYSAHRRIREVVRG